MVNWNRIFDNVGELFDEEATLLLVDDVIGEHEWTDEMAEALDSIILHEEGVNGMSRRLRISLDEAADRQNLGYRTLRKMADDGWIHCMVKKDVG